MSRAAKIAAQALIWNGANATCMARIQDISGVDIKELTINSITCKVIQIDDTSVFTEPTVNVAASVFDDLQTQVLDPTWPFATPDPGYNFKFELVPADVPLPNQKYQVQFTFLDESAPKKTSKVVFLADTGNLL